MPSEHKMDAHKNIIHRITLVPLSTTIFNIEVNINKQITFKNGCDNDIVDKLLYRKLHELTI